MITRKKIYEILAEEDETKREEMLAALPQKELESLLKDAEKLHREAEKLHRDGKRIMERNNGK